MVPWVHEAGNPTFDWFFGGRENARRVLTQRMALPSSEVSIRRMTALFEDNQPIGGFIALDRRELERARRNDIMSSLRGLDEAGRRGFLDRVAAVGALQLPIEDDQFYLSMMGVRELLRGGGRGRILLREFLAQGRKAGFRRFRLEVRAENAPAIRLYTSEGFKRIFKASNEIVGLTLVTMLREEP
jgi:ribosomal protein S18 acetylase RimI-like enzyme